MDLVCIEMRQMTEVFHQVNSELWQTEFEQVWWVLGKKCLLWVYQFSKEGRVTD